MVFHLSLNNSKSLQVSRTLLSILANLNNAVVWMVSTLTLISKSSNPCINSLLTVPKALITICIIVTLMFHSFFNSLERSRYISFFSLSFNFTLWSAGTAKSTIQQVLLFFFFFFFFFGWFGRLAKIRHKVSQNPRGICVSHFPGQMLACAYNISSYGKI